MTEIAWLDRTLRVTDNPLLDSDAAIIPVVIDDPARAGTDPERTPAWGPRKRRFWHESITELEEELDTAGTGLVVRRGDPVDVLSDLVAETGADRVRAPEPIAWYARQLRSRIADQVPLTTVRTNELYHPDQLPFSIEATPDTFTTFKNRVEDAGATVRDPIDPDPVIAEDLPDSDALEQPAAEDDDRTSMPFHGGPRSGSERVQDYIASGAVDAYADRRNELQGTEYSSKLSPYLAVGALSPRTIWHRLEAYRGTDPADAYAIGKLQFELQWREFFRYSFQKHGTRYFTPGGIQDKDISWQEDPALFQAWCRGQTGVPIIDACMRELTSTGYMSNRGRQLVASFLIHNLNLDWRTGARYMEHALIDSDVHSNWGNWAYVAGVGTDSRDRYFNILKQARKYDPEASFVKAWLPQLGSLPADHAHAPWKLSDGMAQMHDIVVGEDYPEPIIDLEASYAAARERFDQR